MLPRSRGPDQGEQRCDRDRRDQSHGAAVSPGGRASQESFCRLAWRSDRRQARIGHDDLRVLGSTGDRLSDGRTLWRHHGRDGDGQRCETIDPWPLQPRWIRGWRGAGRRSLSGLQLREELRGLQVPVADGRWQPLFQLPAAPADFTGRQAECKSVLGALARENGVPVVAISGQPGIGKTALALRAAHQARDRFPDGQLWVQLAGASARPRDPGEVLGELLRAFGVPGSAVPDDHAERASVFRSRVAGRRLLVVADDAASAEQVATLLPERRAAR